MVQNAVDDTLQENIYMKIRGKVDTNGIHEYEKLEEV